MRYSLDQLLEATGVDKLGGDQLKKTASVVTDDFSKLADRCRQAAAATAGDETRRRARDLVEKTAAVAIIQKTLEEIRTIEGNPPSTEKTASPNPDQAVFIKAALTAGHSPEDIAQFLDRLLSGQRTTEETRRKTGTTIIS